MKNNMIIRRALLETGVKSFHLCHILNMSEATLYRKLRSELPEDEQKQIANLIEEFARERNKYEQEQRR